MQSAPAPSKSLLLNSVKSAFANHGSQALQANSSPIVEPLQSSLPVQDVISDPATKLTQDFVEEQGISEDEKMALFDSIMDEVETNQTLGQVAVSIDPNQNDSLNPQASVSSKKESVVAAQTVEVGGGSSAQAEYEPAKELTPEVESYIEHVEDDPDQLPQEIVIADGSVTLSPVQYPAQPVIVLPITPEIEEAGIKKSPVFSVRWLVEWSRKIIKMFSGKVVYKSN